MNSEIEITEPQESRMLDQLTDEQRVEYIRFMETMLDRCKYLELNYTVH